MTQYADTSFLVPLYVMDVHSARASAVMSRVQGPVLITAFGEVELCNALQLRVFRSTLAQRDAQVANLTFERDILSGTFVLRPFSSAVLELAKRLSRKHTAVLGTRSLDLVHVASALIVDATAFLSFDNNQRKLAHAAGLALFPKTL